jgi:hypothetical protein
MAEIKETKENGETVDEKIARQIETVKKLEEAEAKNSTEHPSPELLRETDLLRHLTNSQTGSAKARAMEKAEFARLAALDKAIRKGRS